MRCACFMVGVPRGLIVCSSALVFLSAGCGESDEPWGGAEVLDVAYSVHVGPTESQLGGPYGEADVYGVPRGARSAFSMGHLSYLSTEVGPGFWSSDHRRLAITDGGGSIAIASLDADGHAKRKSYSASFLSFSPDGEHTFFTNGTAWIANSDGGNAVRAGTVTSARYGWFSPDSGKVAFDQYRADVTSVIVTDLAGNEILDLAAGDFPSWAPDSERLLFRLAGGSYEVRALSGAVTQIPVTGAGALGWSADSSWLAFDEVGGGPEGPTTHTLVVVSADGAERQELTNDLVESDSSFARAGWSPVDPVLAFRESSGNVRLWSPDGVEASGLPAGNGSIFWSHDGSILLTTAPLAWIDRRADTDAVVASGFLWRDALRTPLSPDGSRVLALTDESGLAVLAVEDGSGVSLAPSGVVDEVWAGDGERVAYATESTVSLVSMESGETVVIRPRGLEVGTSPRFAH